MSALPKSEAIEPQSELTRPRLSESCATMRVLSFLPDGTIQYLDHPSISEAFAGVGTITKRRASHIVPNNAALRLAFVVLRLVFGESGRVACWTRGWSCSWQVDLRPSGGPVYGCFADRQDAIASEESWLVANRF